MFHGEVRTLLTGLLHILFQVSAMTNYNRNATCLYVSGITKEFIRKWASVESVTYINNSTILYISLSLIFCLLILLLKNIFQIIFGYLITYLYI